MKSRNPRTIWSNKKLYAGVMLLVTVIGASAGVISALRPSMSPPLTQVPSTQGSPSVSSTSGDPLSIQHDGRDRSAPVITEPGSRSSATSVANHAGDASAIKQSVCGEWLSVTSRKRYNFICRGKDDLEIYEVGAKGQNKRGTGKVTENGIIEAVLLVADKNRKAYLKLTPSDDGRKLEGPWHGDAQRESGQLIFYKT